MHFGSKTVAVFIGSLMLALIFFAPPAAQASETDRLTHFMVNQQFEVPGKVLEPNTRYVIKLHDLYMNRNVVQVFTDDEKQMLTEFLAINDERARPADKTTFTFIETQPGFPKPIRSWFYPGRNIGLEFVYPKEQALEIARHAKEPILTTETAVNLHNLGGVTIVAQEPITGEFTTIRTAQVTGPSSYESEEAASAVESEEAAPAVSEQQPVEEPESQIALNEEVQKTEPEVQREKPIDEPSLAEEEQVPEQTAQNEPATAELPRTAGELPLVGLIGMLCLGVGLGLKVLSARS